MSTATSGSSAFSTLARRARDRFLLSDALKEAVARDADRQALIRVYYAAALDRSAVADQLNDERGAVAAMLLYREALPLLVASIALAHDPDFRSVGAVLPAGASAWEVLLDLFQRRHLPALPKNLDVARAALEAPEPLTFDRLPPQTLLDRRAAVQVTMRRLRRLVDVRTPSELKSKRAARLLGVVILVGLILFGIAWAVRSPDLALGKPVTVSSRHPASIAPPDNSGLTNGVIEPAYGIMTNPGPGWVMVDLQANLPIWRVEVFNRRDTDFDMGLPLMLETSSDGVTFKLADTRSQPFSSSRPWIFRAPRGTRGRFIRIRSNTLVALNEVEVY